MTLLVLSSFTFNIILSHNSNSKISSDFHNERRIRNAVRRFSPYIYTSGSETSYPTSLENLKINWGRDLKNSYSSHISFNYNEGNLLNQDTPIYVKVHAKKNGDYLLTYSFIFANKECGSFMKIKAKGKKGKKAINVNLTENLCPIGKSNGGIEHIQIILSRNYQFKKTIYSYHGFKKTYLKNEISWYNTHPTAYMAKGTHGMYTKTGKNYFISSSCKTCKIPVKVKFYDVTAKERLFKGKPKIIASNALKINQNSLTEDEKKILHFNGRFGEKIQNNNWLDLEEKLVNKLNSLFRICSKSEKFIRKILNKARLHEGKNEKHNRIFMEEKERNK